MSGPSADEGQRAGKAAASSPDSDCTSATSSRNKCSFSISSKIGCGWSWLTARAIRSSEGRGSSREKPAAVWGIIRTTGEPSGLEPEDPECKSNRDHQAQKGHSGHEFKHQFVLLLEALRSTLSLNGLHGFGGESSIRLHGRLLGLAHACHDLLEERLRFRTHLVPPPRRL